MGASLSSGSVVFDFPAVVCYRAAYYGWSWVMGGLIALWLLVQQLSADVVADGGIAGSWLVLQSRSAADEGRRRLEQCSHAELALWRCNLTCKIQLRAITELHVPFLTPHSFRSLLADSARHCLILAGTSPYATVACMECSMETRREYAFRSIYGALYDSFRADAVGWIVVVWVRRMLLIVLSVVLTASPSARYLSFLLLHLAIYCLHGLYQPFSAVQLNEAEQVSILVHVVIAGVLTAYPSPTDSTVQSTVLSLTVAPLVLHFMYQQAQKLLVRTKRGEATVLAQRRLNPALSMSLLQPTENSREQ